jgi:hypothetical protein
MWISMSWDVLVGWFLAGTAFGLAGGFAAAVKVQRIRSRRGR